MILAIVMNQHVDSSSVEDSEEGTGHVTPPQNEAIRTPPETSFWCTGGAPRVRASVWETALSSV